MRICSVPDCTRKHAAKGLCHFHWQRAKRGVPFDRPFGAFEPSHCSIEGCTGQYEAKGFCAKHYTRWRKGGSPDFFKPKHEGPRHHNWSETPSYASAHERVERAKGKARDNVCVDCGMRAYDWSYIGGDPAELREVRAGFDMAYSGDPAYYQPRCRSCHNLYDGMSGSRR